MGQMRELFISTVCLTSCVNSCCTSLASVNHSVLINSGNTHFIQEIIRLTRPRGNQSHCAPLCPPGMASDQYLHIRTMFSGLLKSTQRISAVFGQDRVFAPFGFYGVTACVIWVLLALLLCPFVDFQFPAQLHSHSLLVSKHVCPRWSESTTASQDKQYLM